MGEREGSAGGGREETATLGFGCSFTSCSLWDWFTALVFTEPCLSAPRRTFLLPSSPQLPLDSCCPVPCPPLPRAALDRGGECGRPVLHWSWRRRPGPLTSAGTKALPSWRLCLGFFSKTQGFCLGFFSFRCGLSLPWPLHCAERGSPHPTRGVLL